jgi:hypothetical protein
LQLKPSSRCHLRFSGKECVLSHGESEKGAPAGGLRGAALPVGVYTLPDAARLLGLPLPRLRLWVLGRDAAEALGHRGTGKDRTFDFYTLIELFTIGQLRAQGLSWPTLRKARAELMERSKRRTLLPWRASSSMATACSRNLAMRPCWSSAQACKRHSRR